MAVFGKYVTCMLLLYAWLVSLQLSDTHLCHSLFRDEEAFDNLTRQALKRSRSWPSLSVIVNIFPESPVTHHSYIFSRGAAGPSRPAVSGVFWRFPGIRSGSVALGPTLGPTGLILGPRRSPPARPPRPARQTPGRAAGKQERPLSAGFVFAHCCGNMRTGGKGLVY